MVITAGNKWEKRTTNGDQLIDTADTGLAPLKKSLRDKFPCYTTVKHKLRFQSLREKVGCAIAAVQALMGAFPRRRACSESSGVSDTNTIAIHQHQWPRNPSNSTVLGITSSKHIFQLRIPTSYVIKADISVRNFLRLYNHDILYSRRGVEQPPVRMRRIGMAYYAWHH